MTEQMKLPGDDAPVVHLVSLRTPVVVELVNGTYHGTMLLVATRLEFTVEGDGEQMVLIQPKQVVVDEGRSAVRRDCVQGVLVPLSNIAGWQTVREGEDEGP